MRRLNAKPKHALLLAGALLAAGATWFGFDHTYGKVLECKITSEAWVTAEYSEYSTYVNADGTVGSQTDYWSEPASERYTAITRNGELTGVYGHFEPIRTGNNYYKPPMPAWDGSMSNDPDFDNFEQRRESKLTVTTHLTVEDVSSTFTSSARKNTMCLDKLDNYIQVKTWYGITYDSEF